LLPQKNRRFAESCEQFLEDNASFCLVSSSVKKTTLDLLSSAHKHVSEQLQEGLLPYLVQKNIKEITCRDCLIFEDFFYVQRKKLKRQGKTEIYYELIGQIEQWVAKQVHEIPRGSKVKAINFTSVILTELSMKHDALKTPIEIIEEVVIPESPGLNRLVALAGVKKMEDIINLSSAISFQFENNTWVIFVTFDEEHVLSNRPLLKEICALHSSKPAYANDYLVKISKLSKPIQFYRNIPNHSVQQKDFATEVKNALQVNII